MPAVFFMPVIFAQLTEREKAPPAVSMSAPPYSDQSTQILQMRTKPDTLGAPHK